MIHEEQNYFRLEENRTKDDQLSDFERDRLIEHGKRIGQNARKLKTEI